MARAELLSIGTELLLGQILNTNAQFLSTELAKLGIDCIMQITVGDNTERIVSSLRLALDRADIVITTGGLGPTADDLTHECIAELFGVDMEFDQPTLDKIKAMFERRGIPMVDSNKKQAQRPRGSVILSNPVGTAPGIVWEIEPPLLKKIGIANPHSPRYLFTFPGVPSEMHAMWKETAISYLAGKFGPGVIWSQELKFYGIGESSMAEKFSSLLNGTNPTVAPLAGAGECRLRISAKATSVESAQALAIPVIEGIKKESGHLCYGIDDDSLESVTGQLLASRGTKVSLVESCTGGLVSKRLTDIAGSSAFMSLNLITYSNEAKQNILNVKESTLTKHGAVSPECAREMAAGMLALSKSDIALSLTGIAGPSGGTADKPIGLVYIGFASRDFVLASKRLYPQQFSRSEIRYRSASDALNMIRLYLLDPELLKREYSLS